MSKLVDADDVSVWVGLSLIDGLGGQTLCQLLSEFGSPANIYQATTSQLRHIVSNAIANEILNGLDLAAVQPTLDWLQQDGNHIITLADAEYPQLLLEINNPPPILYAKGHLHWLNHASIAIVGSRSSTPQGEKNAEDFATSLANFGLCVVSGLALGIDGAAHRGALKATSENSAGTIAVVGTGLDIVYPARHRDLAHKIVQRGLIISEFPLGTPSKAQNFPRRNRIISGLSLGCLVVEANVQSGSLITAKLAAEQGREVFAIPGSIHSPVAKGCHLLIKQGAKLVESTQDIIDELSVDTIALSKTVSSPLAENSHDSTDNQPISETDTLIQAMGHEPIAIDTLIRLTKLTIEKLSAMLMMLELEGKVATVSGGHYQRIV